MTELQQAQRQQQVSPRTTLYLAFLIGVLFALLQYGYFFLLEVHLSSRASSFFVALFCWLMGFLIGLNLRPRSLFPATLVLSVASYYLALAVAHWLPYNQGAVVFLGLCIGLSGIAPGCFFPYAEKGFSQVRKLFLHENNGFLLGILIAFFCAIFAGKWLLRYAPCCALIVSLALLWYERHPAPAVQRRKKQPASVTPDLLSPPPALQFYWNGIHFGILQAALFLGAQVYITATYLGYFAVVLTWMAAVLWSLRGQNPWSLEKSRTISLGAFYAFLLIASIFLGNHKLLVLYVPLLMLVAWPAGTLFREFMGRTSARSLFLHENNGFVLGMLVATFGFIQWGVQALFLLPLLSFALAQMSEQRATACHRLFLPVTVLLSLVFQSSWMFGALLVVQIVALLTHWQSRSPSRTVRTSRVLPAMSGPLCRALLLIAGCNLILLQFFLVREFSSILAASELSILLIAMAYFVGFSVGYGISHRLAAGVLRFGVAAMFGVHLLILLGAKVFAGYLIAAGSGWLTLSLLLAVVSFLAASLYSVFLPRLIGSGNLSLASAYSYDLIGAVLGSAVLMGFGVLAPRLLLPLYFLLLLAMVVLLWQRSRLAPGLAVIGLALVSLLVVHQPALTQLATEDYYRTRDYDHPQLSFQGNSFYHSIEVIDSFHDAERQEPWARTAFINGVPYFRRNTDPAHIASLDEFTYFLAEFPAQYLHNELQRKLSVLILGAGSMTTIRRVHEHASDITLVEIDPLVVQSANEAWGSVNQLEKLDNYEVVIDDARHFLRNSERDWDLIINDISAPYYLGTTLLHSKEFYELVNTRLESRGLFAESTQGRPYPDRPDSASMKILRGVADVFPRWRLVDCHSAPRSSRGYVYAARNLRLDTDAVADLLKENEHYEGTAVYWEGTSRFKLHQTEPFSLVNMEGLLAGNIWRIQNRLGLEEDDEEPQASWLATALDRGDEKHSRLLAAGLNYVASPPFLGGAAMVLLLAIGASLFPARLRARRPTPALAQDAQEIRPDLEVVEPLEAQPAAVPAGNVPVQHS